MAQVMPREAPCWGCRRRLSLLAPANRLPPPARLQCGSHQQLRRALELVAEMRARGIALNIHTYRSDGGLLATGHASPAQAWGRILPPVCHGTRPSSRFMRPLRLLFSPRLPTALHPAAR